MTSEAIHAIDLFAGPLPGGWDLALTTLGIDPLGIEWDDAACATREAAGLRTKQADVAGLEPAEFTPVDLLLASPPCPSFSSAGKREGIHDLPLVYEAASAIDAGEPVPDLDWRDERSALVIEPLRWALVLEPDYMAWEQVPPVLPFWEFCAGILRERGWSVFTGILEAERYGVPQTRERAILMASRVGIVHPPRPTHQRYVKGEPQRHEVTLEGEVLPWVSMAEALGWSGSGTLRTGQNSRVGRGEDGVVPYERDTGAPAPALLGNCDRWKLRNGNRENAAEREMGEPAPTLHFGARSNKVDWLLRNGNQDNATEREAEEPASTIAFGHNAARVEWVMEKTEDRPERKAQGAGNRPRSLAEPAATIDSRADLSKWRSWGGDGPQPDECPATTVAGDPRLSSRTHHNHGEQAGHAIRVSLEEAAVLQTFPPDYPFQGTKSQRFLQVGNAVPPLLAHAVLSALLPVPAAQKDPA